MNKYLSLITLVLIAGCSSPQIIQTVPDNLNKSTVINNNVETFNSVSGFQIKLTPATTRVKSFKLFLSTSADDPVGGTNPYNNGFVYSTDVTGISTNATIPYPPLGGPYYVYVVMYDDIFSSVTKNNITAVNSSLVSADKQFVRSGNSINVTSNTTYTFSDNGTNFTLDLKLKPINTATFDITPTSGSNNPTDGIGAN